MYLKYDIYYRKIKNLMKKISKIINKCQFSNKKDLIKVLSLGFLPEEIIFKKKPQYLLLLSWHISKELIKNLKSKGYKGKFIIPLPKIKIC